MPTAAQKAMILAKRDTIVQMLLRKGWRPNNDFLNRSGYHHNTIDFTTGKWGDEYYLISADKTMAITAKKMVINVFDGRRKFCKCLSLEVADIEITDIGLKSSHLMLLF